MLFSKIGEYTNGQLPILLLLIHIRHAIIVLHNALFY